MESFMISGIQQLGVGTENFRKSWDWYIDMFGVDVKILEDDTVAERMLPYTGGKPQQRHACIAVSLQGGGGFEIWQYSKRKPEPCPFAISVGDLGIFAAKLNCRDVEAFHREVSAKWKDCSSPEILPDGTPCFYIRDLYGNCFQIVENKKVFIEQNRLTGGMAGAVIGVTDMEASVRFYGEVLGYDIVKSDTTGIFSESGIMPDADKMCRRVILAAPERKGAFAKLFGDTTIELVQALERTPRKIYEGRYWGDPGFIQICFDVTNMKALGAFCAEKGHPFTVDSCPDGEQFDMGDASGHFTYIEDPDGTLIEFVETHKVPVVKKLGWFIDMRKRNPEKSLPKFLFRMMGLVSRQRR
ncbi:MAG: VOC family protein [Bacteroidales bacterium]|nr:VOC family protein [Bacteroidales bacterium]